MSPVRPDLRRSSKGGAIFETAAPTATHCAAMTIVATTTGRHRHDIIGMNANAGLSGVPLALAAFAPTP